MKLVLYNPKTKRYLSVEDGFVDDESDAAIFDTILAADTYSAYVEHTYGILLYTKQYEGKK